MSQSWVAKWTMLTWMDFSPSRFMQMDMPLNTTPQFGSPLSCKFNFILARQQANISLKLKKSQKSPPPFVWDTSLVIGTEVIMTEEKRQGRMDLPCMNWLASQVSVRYMGLLSVMRTGRKIRRQDRRQEGSGMTHEGREKRVQRATGMAKGDDA